MTRPPSNCSPRRSCGAMARRCGARRSSVWPARHADSATPSRRTVAGAGRGRVRVGRPRRRSGGGAHGTVLVRRSPPAISTAAADFADQACRGASHDDPSMRVSAQTAAAAVAALGSGSEVDIERFAALVRQRNGQRRRALCGGHRRRGRFDARRARRRRHVPHAGARVRRSLNQPPTCLLQMAGRSFEADRTGNSAGPQGPFSGSTDAVDVTATSTEEPPT